MQLNLLQNMPMLIPTQLFTSPNNNLSYPIIILADCKLSNLIQQLQCTKCNAVNIRQTGQMLSKHMKGNSSTCITVNSNLQVSIHTIFHQLPFLCALYITLHFHLTMPTTSLKWHTNLSFNPDNLH